MDINSNFPVVEVRSSIRAGSDRFPVAAACRSTGQLQRYKKQEVYQNGVSILLLINIDILKTMQPNLFTLYLSIRFTNC